MLDHSFQGKVFDISVLFCHLTFRNRDFFLLPCLNVLCVSVCRKDLAAEGIQNESLFYRYFWGLRETGKQEERVEEMQEMAHAELDRKSVV